MCAVRQLRDALSKAAVRVIDLFREWDDDNNGRVSREEFHRAMREMKFEVPAEEVDKLFDEWDRAPTPLEPAGAGAAACRWPQTGLTRVLWRVRAFGVASTVCVWHWRCGWCGRHRWWWRRHAWRFRGWW